MATVNPQVTTPEERTKERDKIITEQKGLSGPDLEQQKRLQRQDMMRQIAQETFGNLGSSTALAETAQKAQAAGTMLPSMQQKLAGEEALKTVSMSGDAETAKQEQRAKQSMSAGQEALDRLALETARRAFDLGYNAKQLSLHANSKVADLAFQQMYDDFQAGRMTKKEIETLQRDLASEAMRVKRDAEIALKDAMLSFTELKERGNAAKAKARLMSALNRYKDAMKTAARASNSASILSGVFTIGGAVVGGFAGGPAGAAAGAQVGGAVAPLVSQ